MPPLQVGSIINFAAVYLLAPVPAAPGGAAALSLASKVRFIFHCCMCFVIVAATARLANAAAASLHPRWAKEQPRRALGGSLVPYLLSLPGAC